MAWRLTDKPKRPKGFRGLSPDEALATGRCACGGCGACGGDAVGVCGVRCEAPRCLHCGRLNPA